MFKALADETRRALLDRLFEQNGLTLAKLVADMGMTRQAVSQHLQVLEQANLVVTAWKGREKLHFLNPVPIHSIATRWIHKFESSKLQAIEDLKAGLEDNGSTGTVLRDLHRG